MAENKMYFTLPGETDILKVSYDAVASIAKAACLETKGVCGIADAEDDEALEIYKGVAIGKGSDEQSCVLKLYITVTLGEVITDTAKAVQENVKRAVESCTSLKAEAVDVFVSGITFPKE